VPEFQDDPTVNNFGIVVLLGQICVYAEKKVFGEEEGKTNLGRRKSVKTHNNCKN